MKIRLFGMNDCEECINQKECLDSAGLAYEFIDALADSTQKLCDENRVDEVPHIQVLVKDRVIYEHVGLCDPQFIKDLIQDVS